MRAKAMLPGLAEGGQPRPRQATRPPANAPTPSSRPGASCANSAAARGGPGNWPRPSTSFKPARSGWKTFNARYSGDPRGSLAVTRLQELIMPTRTRTIIAFVALHGAQLARCRL